MRTSVYHSEGLLPPVENSFSYRINSKFFTMAIMTLDILAPTYLPSLISYLQFFMLPIIHTPYTPATLCSLSFSDIPTLSNFCILGSRCSYWLGYPIPSSILDDLELYSSRTSLLVIKHAEIIQLQALELPVLFTWNAFALDLQWLATFHHSGFSLSITSPKRLTLTTLSKVSVPIPAPSSLILILFNYLLNIYHPLKFLAYFFKFYYLYPSFQ